MTRLTNAATDFRGCAMDSWHATFLGRRHLPREVGLEVAVFFQYRIER